MGEAVEESGGEGVARAHCVDGRYSWRLFPHGVAVGVDAAAVGTEGDAERGERVAAEERVGGVAVEGEFTRHPFQLGVVALDDGGGAEKFVDGGGIFEARAEIDVVEERNIGEREAGGAGHRAGLLERAADEPGGAESLDGGGLAGGEGGFFPGGWAAEVVGGLAVFREGDVDDSGGPCGVAAGVGHVDAERGGAEKGFVAGLILADGADEIGGESESRGMRGEVKGGAAK